jgi:hypothetical protein
MTTSQERGSPGSAHFGRRLGLSTGHRQECLCYLLLEEIFEGLAGVVVARRGRRGRGRGIFLGV